MDVKDLGNLPRSFVHGKAFNHMATDPLERRTLLAVPGLLLLELSSEFLKRNR
jgi:hypothetical protein